MDLKSIGIENGDIQIINKRMSIVDDKAQKIQKIRGLLQINKGELFYNADAGLQFSEVMDIKEKNIPVQRKKIAITEALIQSGEVKKVGNVVIKEDKYTRNNTIGFEIILKDGTTEKIGGVQLG